MLGLDELDYGAAIERLRQVPDYEKTPTTEVAAAYFHHGRIIELWAAAGDPHTSYPIVIVGGSDGKGSTAAMLANILSAAGYRVGLYTKPHFHTYRERMRINGQMIEKAAFAQAFAAAQSYMSATTLDVCTRTELMITMGLDHFRRHHVDVAVIEGNIGGYIDLLSVIHPAVVAYGSISLEHSPLLGTTIREIAREKSGLMKPGCSVVSHPQLPEALEELQYAAEAQNVPLIQVGKDVLVEEHPRAIGCTQNVKIDYQELKLRPGDGVPSQAASLSLRGRYQYSNAGVAVTAAILFAQRFAPIRSTAIADGLVATEWPGRLELVEGTQQILLDGAHNPAKLTTLAHELQHCFSFRNLVMIFGASSDKDVGQMLSVAGSVADRLILTASSNPRSVPVAELAAMAYRLNISVEESGPVDAALERAKKTARPDDLICIAGSMYVVIEARVALGLAPHHESSW